MADEAIERAKRRSHVLLKANARGSDWEAMVHVRDLSTDGALIEGEPLRVPTVAVGDALVLTHPKLAVEGEVSWVDGRRFGLRFTRPLAPEEMFVPVD